MKKTLSWESEYFCGNRISSYGLQNGYVDYSTLSKAFDCVLNNQIMNATGNLFEEWELVNGANDYSEEIEHIEEKIDKLKEKLDRLNITDYEDEREYEDRYEELTNEIDLLENDLYELECEDGSLSECEWYQTYIISENGARILQDYTDEIVFYNDELDMYVWCVCHFGTAWNYVLTNIKLYKNPETATEVEKTEHEEDYIPFC